MYTMNEIKNTLEKIAEQIKAQETLLTELDGMSGDGDLGITAVKLSEALKKMAQSDIADPGMLFMKTGMEMNKQAPSTMGTLLAAGVMSLGKAYKGKTGLTDEDITMLPRLLAEEIMKRGKAALGDKTILDALIPMADAVQEGFAETGSIKEAYSKGAKAAKDGAERTRGMIAKTGRASWIADRTKDNLDGGAVLCAKIAELYK